MPPRKLREEFGSAEPDRPDFQGIPVDEIHVGLLSVTALPVDGVLEMDDEVEVVVRGTVVRVEGMRRHKGVRHYVRLRAVVKVDELVKVAHIGHWMPDAEEVS